MQLQKDQALVQQDKAVEFLAYPGIQDVFEAKYLHPENVPWSYFQVGPNRYKMVLENRPYQVSNASIGIQPEFASLE